jgi:hypothetical protein
MIEPDGLFGEASWRGALLIPDYDPMLDLIITVVDEKCFCDDQERITELERKVIYGQRGQKCWVKIACKANCERFPLGYTGLPVRRPGTNLWDIPVCISTRLDKKSQDLAIRHEMRHARRFCSRSAGIGDIDTCKTEEQAAYTSSCQDAFPGNPADQRRCVKCGVFFSCRYFNRGVESDVKDQDPECKYKDIGLSLKRVGP